MAIICGFAVATSARAQPSNAAESPIVPRAGQPGPRMWMGTSVMPDQAQNLLLKSLGFAMGQTDSDHLTVNEPFPSLWDWKDADAGLAAMRAAGMNWQYFPHFHWAPDWYRKSSVFVPSIGLRSGRTLAAISIWSPDIVSWFDQCYTALAAHYGGGNDKVYALYLGIHGDFGETIFPMGWHPEEVSRFGTNGTGAPDFWCGDPSARQDFAFSIYAKYGVLSDLNAAWGTQFTAFSQVDYPPAAATPGADNISTPQVRRYWLDFLEWYYNSMTRFAGQVCQIARRHFPKSLLEIPIGGGNENVLYGQDTTVLPKIARRYGVQVRSTHGGYEPFPQAYAAMIKRIATPCKFYGVPHWLEPPGGISPDNEVGRIMEALSCGNYGFWDWGSNPVGATNVFRDYTNFFTQEKPVVDVALFFPTTDHRLHPEVFFPTRLKEVGAKLRNAMDFDMIDEELIADGGLKPYRVLVWVEGDFVEEKTLKTLAAWIEGGGVLVHCGEKPPTTVEGRTDLGSALLGQTHAAAAEKGPLIVLDRTMDRLFHRPQDEGTGLPKNSIDKNARILATIEGGDPAIWAVPHGKGWVFVAAGADANEFQCLALDVTYDLAWFDSTKTNAVQVNTEPGVYATLLANDEIIFYNSSGRTTTNIGVGAASNIVVPPHSLRTASIKPAN